MSHEVIFISDGRFRGDLWQLSRRGHVWLLGSPGNDLLARAVWDREDEGPSLERGVTTFTGSDDAIDNLYRLLPTIDEHHAGYSVSKPWDVIHVMDLPLDRVLPSRVAEELGLPAVVLESEEHGFAIRRTAQHGDAPADASHRR